MPAFSGMNLSLHRQARDFCMSLLVSSYADLGDVDNVENSSSLRYRHLETGGTAAIMLLLSPSTMVSSARSGLRARRRLFFLLSLMREAFFSGLARWQLPMAMYRPYAEAGHSPQCFARKQMAVFPAYDLQGERCCDLRDPQAPTLHAGRIGLQQQAMVGGI